MASNLNPEYLFGMGKFRGFLLRCTDTDLLRDVHDGPNFGLRSYLKINGLDPAQMNALGMDIEMVSSHREQKKPQFPAANKAFSKLYGSIFKNCAFKSPEIATELMALAAMDKDQEAKNAIRRAEEAAAKVRAASRQTVSVHADPDPAPNSKFDPTTTAHAFNIIQTAYQEQWLSQINHELRQSDQPEAASATISGIVHFNSPKSMGVHIGASVKEQLKAMGPQNNRLREWFRENKIEVVPNNGGGKGVDCLIISLLQHATGNYASQHERTVPLFRNSLEARGMLHSDDADYMKLINSINTYFNISMNVRIVRSQEKAGPFLDPEIKTGEHDVVIWDHGQHYEALKAQSV